MSKNLLLESAFLFLTCSVLLCAELGAATLSKPLQVSPSNVAGQSTNRATGTNSSNPPLPSETLTRGGSDIYYKRMIHETEDVLAAPTLDPRMRKTYEATLEKQKLLLSDLTTHNRLMDQLVRARASKDTNAIASAEQEAAGFIAGRVSRITGNTYLKPLTYAEALVENRKLAGKSSISSKTRRITVISCLVIGISVPLTIYLVRRRKSQLRTGAGAS